MRICHDFSGLFQGYCPEYDPSWDTGQGKKRRFYGHNCNFGRSGRTGQHGRDAELAGQPTPPQRWPAKVGKAQWRFTGEIFLSSGSVATDAS
jgi:hypothetical protein